MVGAEFTGADGAPATAVARSVVKAALKHRLMLLTCGTYDNVVRWIPPLIVNQEQIEEGVTAFGRALAEVLS